MIKKIKYFIEALFIYVCFFIIKVIGINLSKKIFKFIFNFFGPLFKSKEIINNNLKKILNKNYKDKDKIIKDMWSNYGMIFVEYIFLKKFKNNTFKYNHINIKGKEILKKIEKEKKPVIFVSGHFANFELMSMELTKHNIELATIYRPLNNFFLNPFMEFLRKKYICKNQIKKGQSGMRSIVNYLNKNYSIALMVDQRVSEGESLPFFNCNAFTTTLPAQLSLKYNYDIVPIYLSRINEHKFEMEIMKPINTQNLKISKDSKISISIKINEILEEMILKDPSQWILTHNRWK
ncbi:MAG: lysophospholipid acyltransferase family protein [Pelagibacteraceae bacterium]